MNQEKTLKELYNFIAENNESLKSEWEKLPKADKKSLPFELFCISVFSSLIKK